MHSVALDHVALKSNRPDLISYFLLDSKTKSQYKVLPPSTFFPFYRAVFKSSITPHLGYGTDVNQKTCLTKAIAESIERTFFYDYRDADNTSGLAAGTNIDMAKEAAKLELLERDALYRLFCTSHKPNVISSHTIEDFNLKFEESIYQVEVSTNKVSLFCILKTLEPCSIFLGASCGERESIEYLKLKASAEARSVFWARTMGAKKFSSSLSKESFLKLSNPTLKDHAALGANKEFANEFINRVNMGSEEHMIIKERELDNMFIFKIHDLSKTPLNDVPITIVRATSDRLQHILFGSPNKSQINFKRLKINPSDFNKEYFLHPFY